MRIYYWVVLLCITISGCSEANIGSGADIEHLRNEAIRLSGKAQRGYQSEYEYISAIAKWKEVLVNATECGSDTYTNMGEAIVALGHLNSQAYRLTRKEAYYDESKYYCELIISKYTPMNRQQELLEYVPSAKLYLIMLYSYSGEYERGYRLIEQMENEYKDNEGIMCEIAELRLRLSNN